MKKILIGCVIAALALQATSQSLAYDESYRQAVQGAIDEAEAALASSPIQAKSAIAILPIAGDPDGWLAGQLKIALTKAGKTCVEGKEDPMWDEIIKEIKWDERKDDILDKATLDKFGKLKSAQTLLYAFVRSCELTNRYAFFEIELHATDISTTQHVWGGVFAKRYYKPGFEDVGRIDDVPTELREAMQTKMRDAFAKSINESEKIGDGMKFAFLPLVADVKDYALSIVRDALAKSKITPLNLDLKTLAEARMQVRDKPGQADGVMYGALRDFSVRLVDKTPWSRTYEFSVEVQLCVESAARAQLWSDTVLEQDRFVKKIGIWPMLCEWFPSLESRPWLLVVIPLAVLVGLFLLASLLRAMTRVR